MLYIFKIGWTICSSWLWMWSSDPPGLCLPSIEDYGCEPPPALLFLLGGRHGAKVWTAYMSPTLSSCVCVSLCNWEPNR
jgi:hypothetical protein